MRNLNIKFFIVKYIAFIFFAIGIFLDHKIDISEEFDNQVIDIVISMLPMATTIISISLSMNSELIYGIESSKFRKLRKDINFNFMEMLIITILIFILTTICVIINFTISIWFLDIIAIIYAFVFGYIKNFTNINTGRTKIFTFSAFGTQVKIFFYSFIEF